MKPWRFLPVLLFAAACEHDPADSTRLLPLEPAAVTSAAQAVGQVFTATNAAAGNAVLVYDRAADGSLSPAGSYPTGGLGAGMGLGNQGGVTLDGSGRLLLVVNAGDNTVSSFRVAGDGTLDFVSVVPSGGTQPISVTIDHDLAYVLNAGGSGNISGFRVSNNGQLSAISGSSRPLSAAAPGPAQVGFIHGGSALLVTEKGTNTLSTYAVDRQSGLATGPTATPSSGATPFGFAARGELVVVTEAFGGGVDASAMTSYDAMRDGSLDVLSPSVPTTETAACWAVITGNGRFAYATNTGSGSITGYAIDRGHLALLDADGVTGVTGAGSTPIDLALSRNSQFIYALNAGSHAITPFAVNGDGSLTAIAAGITGLPTSTNGLAAR